MCKNGCGALWSMTYNGKSTNKATATSEMKRTDENQVKAGAAGGIEAAVKAINKHIDNADVCCAGCGALLNMVTNGKNN